MNGNKIRAALFQRFCKIDGKRLVVVDPRPYFAGYRLTAFFAFRNDFFGKRRVEHQRASLTVVVYFRHGTTHVYIGYIERRKRVRFERAAHNFRVVSEDLHAFDFFFGRSAEKIFRVFVIV